MVKDKLLLIDFCITLKCNYRCPYCDQGINKTDYPSASEDVAKSMISFLKNLDRTAILQLVGGEPTIHPYFLELAKTVVDNNHYFQTCTNFSKPLAYWENLVNLLGDKFYRVQVSYHPSQIKDKSEFIDKLLQFNKIKNDNTKLILASVLTEENFEDIKYITSKLENSGIVLEIQLKRDIQGNYIEYSPELKEFLTKCKIQKGQADIKAKSSFGIECSAGKDFITISPYGDIGRCYSNVNKLYSLGNICTKYRLYKNSIPCMDSHCVCPLPIQHGCLNFKNKNVVLANILHTSSKMHLDNIVKRFL